MLPVGYQEGDLSAAIKSLRFAWVSSATPTERSHEFSREAFVDHARCSRDRHTTLSNAGTAPQHRSHRDTNSSEYTGPSRPLN
jgi:hypothetical protein